MLVLFKFHPYRGYPWEPENRSAPAARSLTLYSVIAATLSFRPPPTWNPVLGKGADRSRGSFNDHGVTALISPKAVIDPAPSQLICKEVLKIRQPSKYSKSQKVLTYKGGLTNLN